MYNNRDVLFAPTPAAASIPPLLQAAALHLESAPSGTASSSHNERGDDATHGRKDTALSTPKTPAAPSSHRYAFSADLASSHGSISVNEDDDNINIDPTSVKGFLESTFTNPPPSFGAVQNQVNDQLVGGRPESSTVDNNGLDAICDALTYGLPPVIVLGAHSARRKLYINLQAKTKLE